MISMTFKGEYASFDNFPIKKIQKGRFLNKNKIVSMTNIRKLDLILENYNIIKQPFTCRMNFCTQHLLCNKIDEFIRFQIENVLSSDFEMLANIFGINSPIMIIHHYENVYRPIYYIDEKMKTIDENVSGKTLLSIYPSGKILLKGLCIETNAYSLKKLKSILKI
jgi:hypothetical protein